MERVRCLNENLTLDSGSNEVRREDYGLEWISHLTEGDRRFIAKRDLACAGEGLLMTKYFHSTLHATSWQIHWVTLVRMTRDYA